MHGLHKPKRVSWVTDANLCQVRMFISEDSPSQVGVDTQDQMQLKKKTIFCNTTGSVTMPGNVLPPGFGGVNPELQILKNKLAQITLSQWKCPPRFLMDLSWHVTVGEESNEVEIENQRELRVLEAIYPRPSAIPLNSVISLDAENIMCDDLRTPLVPITAIEEDVCEQVSNDSSFSAAVPYPPGSANSVLPSSQCAQAQPQLLAAASAALSTLLTSGGGPDRLIDHDLLVKILSNPAILEEYKKRQGPSAQDMPVSSQSFQIAPNQPAHIASHFCQMQDSTIPLYPLQPSAKPPVPYQHPSPTIPSTTQPALVNTGLPPPKDINYYKSLIQQHGGERQQEATGQNHGGLGPSPDPNARLSMESTPRFMKPCAYFNSPAGCRHGGNCSFWHGSSVQQRASNMPEMQSSKRMKTSREMRGPQPF